MANTMITRDTLIDDLFRYPKIIQAAMKYNAWIGKNHETPTLIVTVGDLVDIFNKGQNYLLRFPGIGYYTWIQVYLFLIEYNFVEKPKIEYRLQIIRSQNTVKLQYRNQLFSTRWKEVDISYMPTGANYINLDNLTGIIRNG